MPLWLSGFYDFLTHNFSGVKHHGFSLIQNIDETNVAFSLSLFFPLPLAHPTM